MGTESTVRDGFLTTVVQQIDTGIPPEARAARDRLCAQGLSESEATQMIALVLRNEMKQMISESRSFDDARFSDLLSKLPELP